MKKSWNVKIDDNMYQVDLNGRKVKVNGESLKLKNYKKKIGLISEEYEIPVGSKTALLVLKNLSSPQLVIDNKDCATGEDYVPTKLPGWAYVFVVLHCINLINGAVGCLLAIIGIAATTSISCNRKLNVMVRVLLNLVVLVLLFGLVFGVAFLVSGL